MRGRPLWFFDGTPTSNDGNISQYNRIRGPLVSERANTNVMFAVERGYDAEAQVMGMEMEGIDIAVLFPTVGPVVSRARRHGPAILRRDLPRLQRLAARFLSSTAPTS